MNNIGAAIIGCGSIFPLHADAVMELENAELRIVVDTDPEKAQMAANRYGCEAASDYRSLLSRDDIQIVHLCTPHHEHAQMAIELLAAGKHVLTEKPMAENIASAKALLEAASNSNSQLGITFQNRYNAASQMIHEYIGSGGLGKLICMKGIVTWHRDQAYYGSAAWRGRWTTEGGGVLINQTLHTLDLLQWFGGSVISVKGSVTTDALEETIEVDDTAHACIDFASGARALFYGTNAYGTDSPVELEIVFEHGVLLQRRDTLYLWKDGQETMLCEPPSTRSGGKSYWGTSHRKLIADFYAHVREDRPFWIGAEEGIKALQLIDDLYEYTRSRKGLRFPPA
ncbi:gfo/Idh/MocA family oxidoreductase [Paenibacillus sp. HJL G12]|uniref:Gfo/Idh/MocA family oxidoreductase n=1 Tax=Paenibacillus dendrobii TaxID=2691084 RepID=A0A7X3IS93_9BACL|nr:Gfo/Idh/MocA family oxidoreductase [Paenibacillus dendrobii]MWV47282.1 gfo/Idh/MocA family oxidoreductase [Paenibacillus dendrobii]